MSFRQTKSRSARNYLWAGRDRAAVSRVGWACVLFLWLGWFAKAALMNRDDAGTGIWDGSWLDLVHLPIGSACYCCTPLSYSTLAYTYLSYSVLAYLGPPASGSLTRSLARRSNCFGKCAFSGLFSGLAPGHDSR